MYCKNKMTCHTVYIICNDSEMPINKEFYSNESAIKYALFLIKENSTYLKRMSFDVHEYKINDITKEFPCKLYFSELYDEAGYSSWYNKMSSQDRILLVNPIGKWNNWTRVNTFYPTILTITQQDKLDRGSYLHLKKKSVTEIVYFIHFQNFERERMAVKVIEYYIFKPGFGRMYWKMAKKINDAFEKYSMQNDSIL